MLKRKSLLILIILSLITAFISVNILAYEPYDLGEFDFEGETVYLPHWNNQIEAIESREPGLVEVAEEKFNCKLEYVEIDTHAWDRSEWLISRLMTGDATHDIWTGHTAFYWDLISEGALFPLSDVLPQEYYENLPGQSQSVHEAMSYQGTKYTFGLQEDVGSIIHTLFNKDLLEAEGLSNPHELYDQNEWTWEAVTEIAEKATRDTTGDDEIDQWGIGMISGRQKYFTASNYARWVKEDENGKLVVAFTDDKMIEAIGQMAEWNDRGIMCDDDNVEAFVDGNIAFLIGHEPFRTTNIMGEVEFNYGVVTMPRGPQADDYVLPSTLPKGNFIPLTAEKPKALVALADFLYGHGADPEEMAEQYLGSIATDRKSLEIFMSYQKEGRTFPTRAFRPILSAEINEAFAEAVSGERSPVSAMEEVESAAQSILDDMFDQ